MSDPKVLNAPERIWLVDDECGWQEARVEGNGVEYIRADRIEALEAEVERLTALLRTLLGMHDAEVFVREPWDTTFNEVRAVLAREGDKH